MLVVLGIAAPYWIEKYAIWRLGIATAFGASTSLSAFYSREIPPGEPRERVEQRFPGWVQRTQMRAFATERGMWEVVRYELAPLRCLVLDITYLDGGFKSVMSGGANTFLWGFLGASLLGAAALFAYGSCMFAVKRKRARQVVMPP